ncbi:hypothetical protein BH02_1711 [Burkholderia pseudomallei]|uniref:DUF3644 domain-containing protein n=1 Tax=Burkholderia pseudomallei TaxID=28450 RepID=UPI0000F28D80|nr:DUF3644 domain-containing protein [Burkholderia pseudomallei]ABN83318.1 conserved hypothetical protein [Burkholderia pseudomallei 668]AJX85602.1 hypothetical protein BH02_1711 [Burkholderia pseudomallei]
MRPPGYVRLIEKAEAALAAAIEIYNKPSFPYREESFSILAINAWELLLKAKVLAENGGDKNSLYEYSPRLTSKNTPSKKSYIKLNRAGNPVTIGLHKAIALLDELPTARLAPSVKANIDSLIAIRDNAVHLINVGPSFSKQVLEIGTASVTNFVTLAGQWFNRDMSSRLSILFPVGFVGSRIKASAVSTSQDERRLIEYLANLEKGAVDDRTGDYYVALSVDVKLRRSAGALASNVQLTQDPNALKVVLQEEDVRTAFPWDYGELVRRCRGRYAGFVQNKVFHAICADAKKNPSLVRVRFLDPGNPRSAKKEFYSTNMLQLLDKHYEKLAR